MKTVKVKAFKRKGKIVKAHSRNIKKVSSLIKSAPKLIEAKESGTLKPHSSFLGSDTYSPEYDDLKISDIEKSKDTGRKVILNLEGTKIKGTVLGFHKKGQSRRSIVISVGKKGRYTTIDTLSDSFKYTN